MVIQSCKLDSAPEFNQAIHSSTSTHPLQFLRETIPCKSIQNIIQEIKYPSCKLFERGDKKGVSELLSLLQDIYNLGQVQSKAELSLP